MAKEILILRNVPRENPGLIEEIITEKKIKYRILDIDDNTIFPSTGQYNAVIVLGGPESANDSSSKMLNELSFIRRIIGEGIPYMGICLGLQTLVKAMGGSVVKCNIPETGFRDHNGKMFKINLTGTGKKDSMLSGIPETFSVFQLHGETVILTPEMTLLGTGDNCTNQIIKVREKAYGFQCHFELTDDLLETWMNEDSDLQKLDRTRLLNDFSLIKEEYIRTGKMIISNFLHISGIFKEGV